MALVLVAGLGGGGLAAVGDGGDGGVLLLRAALGDGHGLLIEPVVA